MEDFVVACPLDPSVPHLVSGSCPSPRTFVPRFHQTPLAVTPWRFAGPSAPHIPGQGTFTPEQDSMHSTHAGHGADAHERAAPCPCEIARRPALLCHRALSGVFSARVSPGLTATITSAGTFRG